MKKKVGMKDEEYKELLAEVNEEMIFFDGYEDALIGYVERFGMGPVALYDRNKCIEILMKRDGMTGEEAEEFFEFNTIGAWVGEATPAFMVIVPRK
jgi:hypothetical protein